MSAEPVGWIRSQQAATLPGGAVGSELVLLSASDTAGQIGRAHV